MRVGAMSNSDNDEVVLFGYGEYVGDEVPPPEIIFMGLSLNEMNHKNPKIVLDNGKVVWGCECWWGSEEKVKASIGGRVVRIVDIDEERAKYKEELKNETDSKV
jgi:hypothetical protein